MVPESSPASLNHTCSPSCDCSSGRGHSGGTEAEEPQTPLEQPGSENSTWLSSLKRWAVWFLTFFGIYSASSVCPFCGAPGCPVGAGGAALVGGFFAALMHYGKNILEMGKRIIAKGKR
jgi:hypothetical protein